MAVLPSLTGKLLKDDVVSVVESAIPAHIDIRPAFVTIDEYGMHAVDAVALVDELENAAPAAT